MEDEDDYEEVELDMDEYQLTDQGKAVLKTFDYWYLRSWKSGHTEHESQQIALSKVNEDIVTVAILRAMRDQLDE